MLPVLLLRTIVGSSARSNGLRHKHIGMWPPLCAPSTPMQHRQCHTNKRAAKHSSLLPCVSVGSSRDGTSPFINRATVTLMIPAATIRSVRSSLIHAIKAHSRTTGPILLTRIGHRDVSQSYSLMILHRWSLHQQKSFCL